MLKTSIFDSNYTMTINREGVSSSSTTYQVINPTTKEVIEQVTSSTQETLDNAVIGAKNAFKE